MGIGTRFFRPRLVSSPRRRDETEVAASSAARSAEFRRVMLPHLDGAYNFARYLTRDASAAEDIVQDAFLRAFRSFDGWRGDAPKAWLLAIVRNCFLNSLAARNRDVDVDPSADLAGAALEVADADDPETIVARQAEAVMLRNTIEALPEPFRETLVLRELEEFGYKEIAQLTNVPIGTVMSRISRAREMLAELILPNREQDRRARS